MRGEEPGHDLNAPRAGTTLKRQLGVFCPLLSECDVVELILNADGQLWVDRLGQPMIAVGSMAAVAAESFIATVAGAAWHHHP